MRKIYITISLLLIVFSLQAQDHTYEFSISFVGINVNTGNYQMALLATPSESVTDDSTDDMGAGFYVPTGMTIGNFVAGNSGLPASEWESIPMGPGANGDAYFLGRDEAGAFSVLLNGAGPFELVLFDVIADPNPSSGEIVFVENGDPVFDTIFIENYINIAAQNLYSQNNPTASSVNFETLSTDHSGLAFQELSIYPNPAKDQINLKSTQLDSMTSVVFHTIDGKKIQSVNQLSVLDNEATIDVSNLSNALYFMTITSQSGDQATYKILIQK